MEPKIDPRISTYIYEFRRPRTSNPTYNSSNVNHSLSLYSGGPLANQLDRNLQEKIRERYNIPSINKYTEASKLGASSNLSNYGSSLLKVEDRDVYKKQSVPYNIISMNPIQHNETIKKYPKFTLEDKDAYYSRRLANQALIQSRLSQSQPIEFKKNINQIAGIHTYELDKNKLSLTISESYGGGAVKSHQYFTPKMLNHVDQFRSLM